MRSKLPVGRFAVEFLVIVVGVLLALAVDQWAERREHSELADEVLQALGAELTTNIEQLERRIAYHEEVRPGLDSLQRLAEDGQRLSLLNSDVLPQGLGFFLLRDTAWETALLTEAVRHFELRIATLLSTTYSLQEALDENQDAISSGIVRPEWLGAADQGGAVIFLAVLMRDLIGLERELQRLMQASVDAIRERLGEDVSLESPIRISSASRAPARPRGASRADRRPADADLAPGSGG